MRQGGEVYYLSGDHLGSTSLTTDSSGGIISEVRYKPYGEERWSNGTSVTDFGFTSQRNERGFGLMDYNARYYSPVLGRFVSPDSIVPEPGSSGGFNRYRYARNNPLKYVDPSGHQGCDEAVEDCASSNQDDQLNDDGRDIPGWEHREEISDAFAKLAIGADYVETGVSTIGIFVEVGCAVTACAAVDALDPIGPPIIESAALGIAAYNEFSLNGLEQAASSFGFGATILADVYGENTFFEQETGDLIIGQDTSMAFSALMANTVVAEAFIDTAINFGELSYDRGRYYGNIPDKFQTRITRGGAIDVDLFPPADTTHYLPLTDAPHYLPLTNAPHYLPLK
ncbi:MAG: RHS repeat-associated core domain-containing protein [Deltaproteobacteria bacterium]|nr:RHS repeat-associated core domain-containing protein [Deltaproteobacteria bacterium]